MSTSRPVPDGESAAAAQAAPESADPPPHRAPADDPVRRQRHLLRLLLAPALLVGLVLVIWLLGATLLPFLVGGLLAVLLHPVVQTLVRLRVPRGVAAVAVTLVVFLVLLGIVAGLLPLLVRELGALSTELPSMLSHAYSWLHQRIGDTIDLPTREQLKEQIAQSIMPTRQYVENLVSYGLSAFSVLLLVLITPFLTAYLLADWPRVLRSGGRLLPRRSAPTLRDMLSDMQTQLGAYIRGHLLIVLAQAVLHAAGLVLIGLNFALLIGIMTGLAALVPVVGNLTMFMVALATAVIQFDTVGPIVAVCTVYGVSQILETTILTPWLIGERVRLHPVWVIFALLIGGSLFGLAGALLAMPVAAVVRVLVGYTAERYRRSSFYDEL